MHAVGTKVPLSKANVTRCVCPACPVQVKSRCSSSKMSALETALKSNPIDPEAVPAVYCASGVAACKDLNTNQSCICGTCAVWKDYKLAGGSPLGYFCRDGFAR